MADAKGKETKVKKVKKSAYYKVDGDKLTRTRKACPKCGPGVLMADHKDRYTCGNCKYTEYKKAK